MKRREYTVEQQIQRAWDIYQIKNIMGRHAYYHEYNRHDTEMVELWVKKEENKATACFGQGHGFQVGYELIADNYDRKSYNIWQCGLNDMIKENPDIENIPENYGIGTALVHLLTTPVIEIADDGLTAQCMVDGNGQITQAYPNGACSTKIMFERYNVDFIKEDGEWKIWKMFIVTDVLLTPAGKDVREEPINITGEMEFKLRNLEEEDEDPETDIILNYPMLAYTSVMNTPEWPPFPEPYSTYSEVVGAEPFDHPRFKKEAQE